jgi:hypothetical protein
VFHLLLASCHIKRQALLQLDKDFLLNPLGENMLLILSYNVGTFFYFKFLFLVELVKGPLAVYIVQSVVAQVR